MTAARARALKKRHPTWSATDIAAKLGVPTQRVMRALASTGKPGRPGRESRPVRLSAEAMDAIEAVAREIGCEPRRLIEGAIAVWILRRDRARERADRRKRCE